MQGIDNSVHLANTLNSWVETFQIQITSKLKIQYLWNFLVSR